jgi:hypothetical protein
VIDDPATVARLMEQMQATLPIPAHPTPELAQMLRKSGLKVRTDRALFIERVFYMGDEGGICCDVTPAGDAKEAFVVSLTHLRVASGHPLSRDIRGYQRERVRRIAESR